MRAEQLSSESRLLYFSLLTTPGIGLKRLNRLFAVFGDAHALRNIGLTQWIELGLPEKSHSAWQQRLLGPQVIRDWQMANSADRFVLMRGDVDYPFLLTQIADPPLFLFCRGNRDALRKPAIAMVGTRGCTAYGKKATEQLSNELARDGWCIVSGLARGIDAFAHDAALRAGAYTIAVLAAGIEQIYPNEHRELANRIAANGLLISEHPANVQLQTGLFPMRNRIIAGMTHGTIVVEAGERSGALITTAYAVQYDREVFAVPGAITSAKSMGPLALIADGATLVRNASDVKRSLSFIASRPTIIRKCEESDFSNDLLDEKERAVCEFLTQESTTFDELRELTKYDLGQLHVVLLSLQMKKRIKQVGPMQFVKL